MDKIKLEVLSHYAPDLKCHGIDGKGCPFNCEDVRCLTIDHINGGGTKHRKSLGLSRFNFWLRNHGFPEGYQVLCWNCNWIKRMERD